MTLINEILDLAKIESGTMAVEIGPVRFGNLRDYVDQTFRQVAEEKGLGFTVELDPSLPASLETDDMRLRQVLRNLLSNAIKFTEHGRVNLGIAYQHDRHRVLGQRHRRRDPARQATADLRGVPAGRRLDEPQVRRYRPGPRDQPRDRGPLGRRSTRRIGGRSGQHVHDVPAAPLPKARADRAAPGADASACPGPVPGAAARNQPATGLPTRSRTTTR